MWTRNAGDRSRTWSIFSLMRSEQWIAKIFFSRRTCAASFWIPSSGQSTYELTAIPSDARKMAETSRASYSSPIGLPRATPRTGMVASAAYRSLSPFRPPSRKSVKPVVPVRSIVAIARRIAAMTASSFAFAKIRVRIPQARDDQPGRERIPRPAVPDFQDDVVVPSDRSFPESPSVVEPTRDALHIRAKGGIALNIGGPDRTALGIFMAWELFLAVAPP